MPYGLGIHSCHENRIYVCEVSHLWPGQLRNKGQGDDKTRSTIFSLHVKVVPHGIPSITDASTIIIAELTSKVKAA